MRPGLWLFNATYYLPVLVPNLFQQLVVIFENAMLLVVPGTYSSSWGEAFDYGRMFEKDL